MEWALSADSENARNVVRAAALMDRGDLRGAMGLLDAPAMDAGRTVVRRLGLVLGMAELVMHESLLPCPKSLVKAAIKACILACFTLDRREEIGSLASMYCSLSHFQDIAWLGLLSFSGPSDVTRGLSDPRDIDRRARLCSAVLRQLRQDLSASSLEMAELMLRLDAFRCAPAARPAATMCATRHPQGSGQLQ